MLRSLLSTYKSSLKYKLLVYFLALSLFPILLASYVYYMNTKDLMVDKDTAHSIDLNLTKIANLDRVFGNLETIIGEITTSSKTTYWLENVTGSNYETDRSFTFLSDIGERMESLKLSNDDLIDAIYILPKQGALPIFKGTYYTSYTGDLTTLSVYRASVESPSRMIWRLEMEPTSGRYQLTLSKSIQDVFDDEVLGVCVVILNLDDMMKDIELSNGQRNGSLYILNEKRQLMYDPDRSRIGTILPADEDIDRMRNEKNGSFVRTKNGERRIVTFTESAVNGWIIVNEIPYSSAVRGVDKIREITFVITIVVGLVAAGIAVYVYISLYRPIQALMRGMKSMERGDFNARVKLERQDELGKLSRAFNFLSSRVLDLIDNVKDEQRKKQDLEVRALQAQITPHFLYNTLNSIKSLARLGRTGDIDDMIGATIDLLRISASHRTDTITIRDELNYVNSYVKIMAYRYDHAFNLTYDLDETLLDYGILKFTIQPIVENCIIHAFATDAPDRRIGIRLRQVEETIELVVSDNGAGFDPDKLAEEQRKPERRDRMKFSGMGIRNIHERLRLNYGDRFGLRFDAKEGRGTDVYVTIPNIRMDEAETDGR